jgi:crotonobetainyl-CoA:carnitine CoA-transferase CaiB-like acyl-CoA transferase
MEREGYFFSARFEGVKMMTELAISDFREKRDANSAVVAVAMLKAFRDVCACLGRKRRAEEKKYQQEQALKAWKEEHAAEIALWLESQETPPEAPISLAERRAALANPADRPTP